MSDTKYLFVYIHIPYPLYMLWLLPLFGLYVLLASPLPYTSCLYASDGLDLKTTDGFAGKLSRRCYLTFNANGRLPPRAALGATVSSSPRPSYLLRATISDPLAFVLPIAQYPLYEDSH